MKNKRVHMKFSCDKWSGLYTEVVTSGTGVLSLKTHSDQDSIQEKCTTPR